MDRKEYFRKYREATKDKMKLYQANYFQENKDDILKKRNDREKETGYNHIYKQNYKECVCGRTLKVCSLYNHRKICIVYKKSLDKPTLETQTK